MALGQELKLRAEKQLYRRRSLVPVFDGVVLLSQFGKKRAKAGGGTGAIAELPAKQEVKVQPFQVARVLCCRDFGLIQLCIVTL